MTVGAAALLLASGRSARFGDQDKLLADLDGARVASRAAAAAREAELFPRFAVVAQGSAAVGEIFSAYGCSIIENARPEAGMGASLALGAHQALASGARACVVLLADMPMVTPRTLQMLARAGAERDAVLSFDGRRRSPPACFSATALRTLTGLSGDKGARGMLASLGGAGLARVRPTELFDIDTQEDLRSAAALLRKRGE